MAVDIATIMQQFTNVGAAETARKGELDAASTELQRTAGAQTGAVMEEARLAGEIQAMVDQLLLDRSSKNKETRAFFGGDATTEGTFTRELGAAIITKHREVQASNAELAERMGASFYDNPLTWVYDQFALPPEVMAHNAKVQSLNQDYDTLHKLQNLAQAEVQLNNAVDANTSKAIMQRNSERLLATATVRAESIRHDALKTGLHIGDVRLATDQRALANTLALHRTEIDVQQLQISRAHLTMAQEAKTIELNRKKLQDADDAEKQKVMDKATATLGMRKLSVREFRTMPQQFQIALESAMVDPNIQEGRLGATIMRSLKTAENLNAPLDPMQRDVQRWLTDAVSTVTSQKVGELAAAKTDAQRDRIIEKGIETHIKQQLANVPDSGSIFSAPPLQSVGKIPAVAQTVLWREYMAPLATNPMAPTKAQQIFDTAVTALVDGKLGIEQAAAEVATIYKTIADDNFNQRNYNKFAIKFDAKDVHAYRTHIRTSGLFAGDKPIDMANATEVKNVLLRQFNNIQRTEEFNDMTKARMFP